MRHGKNNIKEGDILKDIKNFAPIQNFVLFRNNNGLFDTIGANKRPRKVLAGLGKGTSDLIGYNKIVVTKEMVGKQIAIFSAIEVKTAKGKLSPLQKNFIEEVKKEGGIA